MGSSERETRPVGRRFVVLAALIAVACGGGNGTTGAPPGPDLVADSGAATGADVPAVPGDVAPATDAALDAPSDAGADAAPDLPPPPPVPHFVPLGPEDTTFSVGPYVMHTTLRTVALVWETAEEGDTRVDYGPDEAYGATATGAAGTMHEVHLSGLEPARVYHYRACSGERCTRDLTFATAPEPGQPFRFAVYGDSRSDPAQHREVVEGIIDSAPAVVVNVGDVVEHGANRNEYKEMHFDPLRPLGHYVPVYVAIGNHEWKEMNDMRTFREYMAFPEDPDVPLSELSYTVTFGDAFFLVMDNTLDGFHIFFPFGAGDGPPLWQWLQKQARSEAAQNARWRFAFFHYPPDSPCHEDWMNLQAMREHVVPLLAQAGFQAIFTGHVHNYERQTHSGIPVIITGGGGAGLQSEDECDPDRVSSLEHFSIEHHHVTVDLDGDTALVRAVDLDGEVFDVISLER